MTELGYAFYPLDPSKAPSGEDLMQFVRGRDLKSAIQALTNGRSTDPKFQNDKTGDTALHVAVMIKSEVFVKLLIIFDANLLVKNHKQQTALDLTKEEGAKNIADDIEKIFKMQKELDADQPKDMSVRQVPDGEQESDLMLSLDGGGIHGLVFVQVFLEMDKRRKN